MILRMTVQIAAAITLLVEFTDEVVQLVDPSTQDMMRLTLGRPRAVPLVPTDIVIDAYDKEGRALGI